MSSCILIVVDPVMDPCSNCEDDEVCVRSGELGQPECQEGSHIMYM